MEKLSIAPTAQLITILANQNLTWKTALGEWIDNSLDAGARLIQIVFEGKKAVYVRDDGQGCPESKIDRMVRVGDHAKHESGSTKLGRYGIGAKDAALWVGGDGSTIDITSIHKSKRSQLKVNWRKCAESNWEIDSPTVTEARPPERGTQIIVSPITRTIPHGQQWKELLDELGYLYSPAIKRDGVQISFQRTASATPEIVKRWTIPPLEESTVISETVEVDGRKAKVYCGIVKEGHENPRFGLTYFYKFRVIIQSSSKGCGSYNISRICGYVELDDTWRLSKNKDNIAEPEGLYKAVEQICLPVLKRAEELGRTLQSKAFEESVSQQLSSLLSSTPQAKAKRQRGDTHIVAVGTGEGSKHQRAKREQKGERFPSGDYTSATRIICEHLGLTRGPGEVQKPIVYLNLDYAYVNRIHSQNNEDAVVALAVCLIARQAEAEGDNGQMWLKGMHRKRDFNAILGAVLSGIPVHGSAEKKIAAA